MNIFSDYYRLYKNITRENLDSLDAEKQRPAVNIIKGQTFTRKIEVFDALIDYTLNVFVDCYFTGVVFTNLTKFAAPFLFIGCSFLQCNFSIKKCSPSLTEDYIEAITSNAFTDCQFIDCNQLYDTSEVDGETYLAGAVTLLHMLAYSMPEEFPHDIFNDVIILPTGLKLQPPSWEEKDLPI